MQMPWFPFTFRVFSCHPAYNIYFSKNEYRRKRPDAPRLLRGHGPSGLACSGGAALRAPARSLGMSGRSPGCGHREGPGSDSASATLPSHPAAAGPALLGCRRPVGSPSLAGGALPRGLRGRFREGAGAGAFLYPSNLSYSVFCKLRRTKVTLGSARFSKDT